MKLDLKDNSGNFVKEGDTVKILRIYDYSGNSCDLFGVEAHLSAWISCVYVDEYVGTVKYRKDLMMWVIEKTNNRWFALSKKLREDSYIQLFDQITDSDVKIYLKAKYPFVEYTPEGVLDYMEVIYDLEE